MLSQMIGIFKTMPQFKVIENKKASYDYTIVDTFEVGMVLTGEQVKQIRAHAFNINGSYVKLWPNDHRHIVLLTEHQAIGLLMRKRELDQLFGKTQIEGMTLIPLKIYEKRRKFKLLVGLAKGKKAYDKRAADKARSIDDDLRRTVRSQKLSED